MSTAGRASGRATCTARSAARGPGGHHPRGNGAGGPCRARSSGVPISGLNGLGELDPLRPVAIFDLNSIADRGENAFEVERVAAVCLEFAPERAEWADDRPDH